MKLFSKEKPTTFHIILTSILAIIVGVCLWFIVDKDSFTFSLLFTPLLALICFCSFLPILAWKLTWRIIRILFWASILSFLIALVFYLFITLPVGKDCPTCLGIGFLFFIGLPAILVAGFTGSVSLILTAILMRKIYHQPFSAPVIPEKIPSLVKVSNVITPLLGAIISGDLALVRTALQDHPEQLNTAYAQNGNTPLHVAALNGYTDIARLLLEQPGIDTTRTNNNGKTALDLAREKSFEEIVKLLENKQL